MGCVFRHNDCIMRSLCKTFGRLLALRFLPRRWQLPGFLMLGIVAGAGLFVFHISRAASYLSDAPERA